MTEAKAGDRIDHGRVYVAPGGDIIARPLVWVATLSVLWSLRERPYDTPLQPNYTPSDKTTAPSPAPVA